MLLPPSFSLFSFFFFFFLWLSTFPLSHSRLLPIINDQLQTYIVHVKKAQLLYHSPSDLKRWHTSFLPNTTLFSGEPRLLYSYRHSITGFAARLTPQEANAMESMDGFLLAHPERLLFPHTTYTPKFLNLDEWTAIRGSVWEKSFYGEGVIIGVVDSGISPTHLAFDDEGVPPPPIKWKGQCSIADCNNKLIGAKAFRNGDRKASPIDYDGHGTHVTGIAAGNFVSHADVGGMASGRASGMAPKAHLAIYKACFEGQCRDSDVLAAVDQAIHDRIDVLLIPLGGIPLPLYEDSVAVASFAAVGNGIVVCTSVGNGGPRVGEISHEAPWLVAAGASTIDRRVRAVVRLGNGVDLMGESAFQPPSDEFPPIFLPLAFPGIDGDAAAANCHSRSLADLDLRGKIVLCFADDGDNTGKTGAVKNAGAGAVIVMNRRSHGFTTRSEMHELPASHLSYLDGRRLRSYVYSTSTPVAAIVFNGTVFGARPSPAVAAFSSRGPSLMNGGVLKPDIIAPGVNVLSAWPPVAASPLFGFMSGTSMAAAHVAGVAALVRRRHPRWSPAMIHSAIITSATSQDLDGRKVFDELSYNSSASLFASGAGQLHPEGALNPGLVYDIEQKHYLHYLCGLGYNNLQMWAIAKQFVSCNKSMEPAEELNYPSISVRLGSSSEKIVVRTVKSVRKRSTVFWARIEEPKGVRMDLSRYELSFSRVNQEESFEIKFSIQGRRPRQGHVSQGRLSWVSRTRVVSSPILVTFV
ncbi:subtilisin-like protease SBT1.2 [Dendrobium catenatum]|uniref:Subtilisin-like protease SDD1 n=1 Tax=Dendrobium catenatum TaxID=906689 RepID=A0A2I0WBJ7_9ASPA|nr:subtilisin-like protease SBT1.2 [Dendrobium catenatum]PKU73028.1 Subtilisin-like protease SDD1 [Dendrobium catenatum]